MPTEAELKSALGGSYDLWETLRQYTLKTGNVATEEWKYSGDKYGWGYRLNDKKRVLLYLLPRDGFFRVAFVFGLKATDAVLATTVSDLIKEELIAAKVYAEGRGIRVEVRDQKKIKDLKCLIDIKIDN